ncbi:MAG: PH domain-containing protein [Acidobacteriota bacterium]|nr:PH domain-containing protein [Acidobacteriota bacterium]MDE3264849.1 PH domain-containing protein [Acidobacteriota bacterium]
MTPAGEKGAPGGRMPAGLKRRLLALFRVEERPEPPPGSPESLRTFRASPRFFRYSLLKWGLGQTGALFGVVVSTLGFLPIAFWADEGFEFLEFGPWSDLTRAFGPFLIVLFVVQVPLSYLVLRLGYEMRWYMVSDRALRIRSGVYSVREQTMTVVNIQNMAVKRGPLQRLFGIADLEIRTASGGGSDDDDEDSLSRGLLQGLDNADELRNLLLASLRQSRDAGLGDPDDRPGMPAVEAAPTKARASGGTENASVLAAAGDLLAECRALRRAVAGSAEAS